MSTEILSFRIPTSLKLELQLLGKSIERPSSYIAEKAIKEYIKNNKWQIEELKLAEKEIKEAELLPNKNVEKFLDSWE